MASDGPTIVISGAGGWVFPLELARDILSFPALAATRLVLYDIDHAAADRTQAFIQRMVEDAGLPARIEVAPDLRSALRGADVVITVFQVGGVEAYGHDVEIPGGTGSTRRSATRSGREVSSAVCGRSKRCGRSPRRCWNSVPTPGS